MSPGPPRPTGGSSPYPSDDPPTTTDGMHGYGAPPRAPYSGPSYHLKDLSPPICWSVVSHDKGPYGGNHDRFMKVQHKLPGDVTTEFMLLFNFLPLSFKLPGSILVNCLTLEKFTLMLISLAHPLTRLSLPIEIIQNGLIVTTGLRSINNLVSRCTVSLLLLLETVQLRLPSFAVQSVNNPSLAMDLQC